MTIEEVIAIVETESGQRANKDTRLSDLGLDSLDFLSLLQQFPNIPDQMVHRLDTVNDLWLAEMGDL